MKKHRCPICHTSHAPPKARALLAVLIRMILTLATCIPAALATSGLLSTGLWVVATWSGTGLALLTFGMAKTAELVTKDGERAGNPLAPAEAEAARMAAAFDRIGNAKKGPVTAPICPECRRGTCRNCTGWALDETTDQITTCACKQAGHEENR